jgi:hypothetical protein
MVAPVHGLTAAGGLPERQVQVPRVEQGPAEGEPEGQSMTEPELCAYCGATPAHAVEWSVRRSA